MKLKSFVVIAILFALCQSRISRVRGATQLDNTDQPIAGVGSFNFSSVGVQFSTGTNVAGYALNGLQLLFADAEGDPHFSSYIQCLICTDANNFPSYHVNRFIPNDNPTTAGLHTYVPVSPLFDLTILEANTDYWLFFLPLGASSTGAYQYSFTDSTNSIASDGWHLTGNAINGENAIIQIEQARLPMITIDATALPNSVPEPSMFGLLAVGFMVMCGKYRVRS